MTILFRAALCSITIFFTSFSSAEIVQADWSSNGDNLAFLDTRTGMQFLDFNQTLSVSVRDYKKNPYIDGYRLATFEEANELFFSLTGYYSPPNYLYPVSYKMYNLAREMKEIMNNNNSYNGLAAFEVSEGYINTFKVYSSTSTGSFTMNAYNNGRPISDNISSSDVGLMLVKISDVTSSLFMFPFLFLGLLFVTRKK